METHCSDCAMTNMQIKQRQRRVYRVNPPWWGAQINNMKPQRADIGMQRCAHLSVLVVAAERISALSNLRTLGLQCSPGISPHSNIASRAPLPCGRVLLTDISDFLDTARMFKL